MAGHILPIPDGEATPEVGVVEVHPGVVAAVAEEVSVALEAEASVVVVPAETIDSFKDFVKCLLESVGIFFNRAVCLILK